MSASAGGRAQTGTAGAANTPIAGNAGTPNVPGTAGTGASQPRPLPTGDTRLLPARIRRLTNAELDSSVKALLNIDSTFGASFTPDARQDGFTRNDAQRVDPVYMTQLDAAAKQLATQARERVDQLAPCSDQSNASAAEGCARTFITSFAKRAYRRPATAREIEALLTVYRAGADGASYADGFQLTVQAILESPGFLYVTEIGERLTEHEIASALSYLITAAPPDDALLQAAEAGQLMAADARKMHAQRLLASDIAGKQITRMVEEWLGVDRIVETAKDSTVYPEFASLRDAMKREADDFVSEVMWKSQSSVSTLIGADWTIAEDNLARMYLGGQAPQRDNNRVSLTGVRRRGILNQGAFLSVYAHAQETAPVLRGVAVLRRLACYDVPAPTSLNVNIVPPVADPNKTTRERFSIHSQDAACAGCHNQIDPFGFSFEGLDGMGRARTMENGRPIDSATRVQGNFSFDGAFMDSAELAAALSTSKELQRCFAKHLFRTATAHDTAGEDNETVFLEQVAALPESAQGKIADVLSTFVASDLFTLRRPE